MVAEDMPDAVKEFLKCHVDRKVFKMREMRREKKAKVKHISTHENASDMFTKALDNTTFHRHRATNMNLAAVA